MTKRTALRLIEEHGDNLKGWGVSQLRESSPPWLLARLGSQTIGPDKTNHLGHMIPRRSRQQLRIRWRSIGRSLSLPDRRQPWQEKPETRLHYQLICSQDSVAIKACSSGAETPTSSNRRHL